MASGRWAGKHEQRLQRLSMGSSNPACTAGAAADRTSSGTHARGRNRRERQRQDSGRHIECDADAVRRPGIGLDSGHSFRWTQATGTKDLRQILSDSGVVMTGITLVSVTGISPDGQWIQGKATTAQTGQNETVAFIAQFCDDDIGGPCTTTGAAPFTLGRIADPTQCGCRPKREHHHHRHTRRRVYSAGKLRCSGLPKAPVAASIPRV